MAPKVSVCVPCLNSRPFIAERLETILCQTVEDWELIVCDSYSDDGTWEALREFAGDERISLHQVPRQGLYAGWNECLTRARGEYVYIAPVDDTCAPDFLEKMVGRLGRAEGGKLKAEWGERGRGEGRAEGGRLRRERGRAEGEGGRAEGGKLKAEGGTPNIEHPTPNAQHPTFDDQGPGTGDQGQIPRPIDIAVCGFDVIDEGGGVVSDHPACRWPKSFYGDWMSKAHLRDGRTEFILHACLGIVWWTISSVVFRRSLLDRIGLFRTDRGSQADEEWEMRAALASDIVFVPEKLATWRVHGDQATGKLKSVNRTNLDCLEAVLNDDAAGVPDDWKQVPCWREKITHICRTEHLDSFGLYRNVLRRNPKLFINSFVGALRREPGFALRQALRGFPWSPGMSPDPVAYARELIELLGCSWPPRGV